MNVDKPPLRQALINGARDAGDLGWQAAVIIALDGHRGDFLGDLVQFGYIEEGEMRTYVDWDKARDPNSLLSGSGVVLVELAASMSGFRDRSSVNLRLMGRLDEFNSAIVLAAFGHFLHTYPDMRFR